MAIERNTTIILQQDASPFTTMFNDVLQGITNTAALGVYCYLASKPAGWEIQKTELQTHFKCGREHIQTCVNYLKSIGVLEVKARQDEQGRLNGYDWKLLRHIPTDSSIITEERVSRTTGFTVSGKPAPIKERSLQKKDLYKSSEKNLNKNSFGIVDMLQNNPHEIPKDYIEQWIGNRGKHKVTELVWKRINKNLSELRERAINPVDAFERMVTAGWRSLEIDYFKQQFNSQGGTAKTSQWDVDSVWSA